jgi:hypothetical protein
MIVHCLDFGSLWPPKHGTDDEGFHCSKQSAFLNTTAIPRSETTRKVDRCWTVPGYVRFNAAGFPRVKEPRDLRNVLAFTTGIETHQGTLRLLFQCAVRRRTPADAYLVAVRSWECGLVNFKSHWKTPGVRMVASSVRTGRQTKQETLVLMPASGAIATDLGIWQLSNVGPRGDWNLAGLSLVSSEFDNIEEFLASSARIA